MVKPQWFNPSHLLPETQHTDSIFQGFFPGFAVAGYSELASVEVHVGMKHFGLKAHLFPLSEGLGGKYLSKNRWSLKTDGWRMVKEMEKLELHGVAPFIWRHIWLKFHYLSHCRHLNSFDINLDMKLSYYKQTDVKLRCCSQNYRFVVTSKLIQVKLYNTSFSRPLTNNLQQMVAFNKSGAIFHQPRLPVSCNKESCPLSPYFSAPFGALWSCKVFTWGAA